MRAIIFSLTILMMSPLALADHHGGKGKGRPHQKRGGHFKMMDTNNDGKVSKDEFMARTTKRFTEMDANGDGFITKDEKKTHRKKMKENR